MPNIGDSSKTPPHGNPLATPPSSGEKVMLLLFGEFLLSSGVITPNQLKEAIHIQIDQNQLFGELAQKVQKMTGEQVVQVVRALHDDNPEGFGRLRFGEAAAKLGYITIEDIAVIVDMQAKSKKRLGEILVDMGTLTPDECRVQLQKYNDRKNNLSR